MEYDFNFGDCLSLVWATMKIPQTEDFIRKSALWFRIQVTGKLRNHSVAAFDEGPLGVSQCSGGITRQRRRGGGGGREGEREPPGSAPLIPTHCLRKPLL